MLLVLSSLVLGLLGGGGHITGCMQRSNKLRGSVCKSTINNYKIILQEIIKLNTSRK